MLDGSNEIYADVAAQRRQFAVLLAQLRAAEPRFAEASILLPNEVGEWHAAVYLLTGCGPVWERLGPPIMAQCSPSPVCEEMESARRRWTHSKRAAMEWALHFWRPDKYTASFSSDVPRISIHSLDRRRSSAEGTRPDDPRSTGLSHVRPVPADLPSK